MSIGALTMVEAVASDGPIFFDRITLVGDDSYPTGGSLGFEAAYQALVKSGREIIKVEVEEGDGGTIQTESLHWDHTNGLLFAKVVATNAEVANAVDLSNTYSLLITSK